MAVCVDVFHRGETLCSATGSPLAIFGGARATFGVNDGADAAPLIQVALQGGEEVDLTDAQSVAGLNSDAREEARGKLQGLQVQPCCLLHHFPIPQIYPGEC
jgi:hypothetical protein